MSRDLAIALLVSALLHAALALGFGQKTPPSAAPPPAPSLIEILLPPLEPDEIIPAADPAAQPASDPAPAAPMLADLPSVRLDSPFLQPIQPSPPPDLGRPSGLITIPTGRLGNGTGSGLGNIFALADLDQPPTTRPGGDFRPHFPTEMSRAGISGSVEVEFSIDAEGNAQDVRAIASTSREFEAPAIAAVRSSKFTPGKKGGRAVTTSRVRRVIEFNLAAGVP